eukprot:TRINITY_DN7198_c1_g1_i1.p1 TRINITY_DN7198_c1_g1~~TRINITY_DN7198_c1_g1_i1.p1  ORF type:complete len:1603 (+),score=323.46 TRINITY_DN7198_c1_g1_i1:500-4810(+)
MTSMLSALKTIAWANDEGCTIMVQQKCTDVNISIASNVKTIIDVANRLHAREVAIQEELVTAFQSQWESLLNEMVESCLSWLTTRMRSDTYLNPPERTDLVMLYLVDLVGKSSPGGKPAGLNSILQSNTKAIGSLVDSLLIQQNDDQCEWPLPGGSEGWLAGYQNIEHPTSETLQIATIYNPQEITCVPDQVVESWRATMRDFALRLQAVQAQNLSHAIEREKHLNQQALRDIHILGTDLCCILHADSEYPQPQPLPHPEQVTFTDCHGRSILLSRCEVPNCVSYSISNPEDSSEEPKTLAVIELSSDLFSSQWGLVSQFTFTVSQDEDPLVHEFLISDEETHNSHVEKQKELQRLLDASGVRHSFCNDDLLGNHVAECGDIISRSQKLQERLSEMTSDNFDFGDHEIQHKPKELCTEMLEDLKTESGIYLTSLETVMRSSLLHLEDIMLRKSTSLLPCVKGASILLNKCLQDIKSQVQQGLEQFTILDLDFKDRSTVLENQFTSFVGKLRQAPGKARTLEHFKAALAVLQEIQDSYTSIKEKKETCLAEFQSNVNKTSLELKQHLLDSISDNTKLGELDEHKTPQLTPSVTPEDDPPEEVTKSPALERIEHHLEPLKGDTFGIGAIHDGIIQNIQKKLTDWLDNYTERVINAVAGYCEKQRIELESWLSEKLRLHQRRTPKLASHEYDGRMRELVETEEMKAREFNWISKRFNVSLTTAQDEITAAEVMFDTEVRNLQARRSQLPTLQNITNITVHKKTTTQHSDALLANCKKSFAQIDNTLKGAEQTMMAEGKRYLTEHCQTFSNGGLLSEEEVEEAQKSVAEINENGAKQVEEVRKQIAEIIQNQQKVVEEERKEYEVTCDHNIADLQLLSTLSEFVSAVKSRLSIVMSESAEAERKLNVAVGELENIAAHPVSLKKGVAGLGDTATSTPTDLMGSLTLPDDGEGSHDRIHTALTSLLRRAKITRELNLKESRCFSIISLLDQVSKQLYSRALFLSVLDKVLSFQYIPSESYFAPVAAAAEEDGWDQFLQTQPHSAITESLTTSFWEKANSTLSRYYASLAESKRAPTKSTIAESEEGQKERITTNINNLMTQFQTHITNSSSEYKRQVMRVWLVLPKMPAETFNVLFQNCLVSLRGTVGAARDMFNQLHASYESKRLANESQLKGCMINPGNRGVIMSSKKREGLRHDNFLQVLHLFQGVLVREQVGCAELLTQQAISAASTLFKTVSSVVTAGSITVSTDVVVGTHRSLKRLKIANQQQKRNSDPPTDASIKKDAKAAPKPAAKKDGKAAPAKVEAAAGVSYAGAPLAKFGEFSQFLKDHPDVVIPDHISAGRSQPTPEPPAGKQPPAAKKPPAAKDEDGDASLSPSLEGPNEPVFKTIITQRNQCLANFQTHHVNEVSEINNYFQELIKKEHRWYTNWESLLSSLVPEEG